jgi:hypothetical protein
MLDLSSLTTVSNTGTITVGAGSTLKARYTGAQPNTNYDLSSCSGTINMSGGAVLDCNAHGITAVGNNWNFGAGGVSTIKGVVRLTSDVLTFTDISADLNANNDWFGSGTTWNVKTDYDGFAATATVFHTEGRALLTTSTVNVSATGTWPAGTRVTFFKADAGLGHFQTTNLSNPLNEHGINDADTELWVGVANGGIVVIPLGG